MKRILVPRSVRRQAAKGVAWRFVKLCVYLVLAYIVADYIYEGLKTTNLGNLSTTVFFIVLVPFLLSGVPMKLIDRDWYGEIIKIELKNAPTEKIDNHAAPPISQKALVRTPDGKLYLREIFDEGEYFFGERDNVYKVGDKVIHVYGTDYITPVREKGSERPVACVVCGYKAPCCTEFCRHCGSSMDIKLIDVPRAKKVKK